jgi:phosphotransferase system enzyme I (PtsI)
MARIELEGIGAAQGMVVGRARVLYPTHFEVDVETVTAAAVPAESARLSAALETARAELKTVRARLSGELKRELADIVEAHGAILDDPLLEREMAERIRRERLSAEAALKAQRERLLAAFDAIEDPYLRARRDDVEQVLARVYAALKRGTSTPTKRGADDVVLVCETLSPADLLHAHEHGLLGIVQSSGSPYAHSAILARSLKLPHLVQVREALNRIRDGDHVLVDGAEQRAIVHPDALDLARLRAHQAEARRDERRRSKLKSAATRTTDGARIALHVNAEKAEEIAVARRLGAAGVGLFRTEFLFLRAGEPPDEDEQFRAYRDAVIAMAGRPVTLRTLDLGADKVPQGVMDLRREENPALGLRGVRLSLARPDVFAMQLRAMLRASAYGPVRILLPMVSRVDEVLASRALLEACRADLVAQRHAIAEEIELGAMVEVPGAALASAGLQRAVDFLAIGSNDLTQYTLAADRNNADLAQTYDPLHPAVLRLIALTVDNARRARKSISLCGELAGDPRMTALLIALGLTELSLHVGAVLEVREVVLGLSRKTLRGRRDRILEALNREELDALLAL